MAKIDFFPTDDPASETDHNLPSQIKSSQNVSEASQNVVGIPTIKYKYNIIVTINKTNTMTRRGLVTSSKTCSKSR